MKVKEVMTSRPVTVKPTDTLGKVVNIMTDMDISGCPVTRGDKIVGIVTQSDVMRTLNVYNKINKRASLPFIFSMIKSKGTKEELGELLKTKVKTFMNEKTIHIDAEEDIYKAAALMHKHKIDRLPAVKGKKLVGIISKKDIVKFLSDTESDSQ